MAGTQERKEARIKLFVEHYLAHGEATAAAQAAGYKGKPQSIRAMGSRLLTEVNRRGLLDKARAKVQEAVEKKVRRDAVEWAERLWNQVDRTEPSEVVEDGNGEVRLRRFRPLQALSDLGRLYSPSDNRPAQVQVNVLSGLPPELAGQAYRALMNGNNGNGHP